MIYPDDIDLYTDYDPKLQKIGYDYSVIPGDDYTTPRTYMKWEHIEETETTLFNLMYAWIGFNLVITRANGDSITPADDISLRQNMWSWFNRQECYMSKINIFNQKDYSHIAEHMMSLLRFSPDKVDKSNSMIYFSPDKQRSYNRCHSTLKPCGAYYHNTVDATKYHTFERRDGMVDATGTVRELQVLFPDETVSDLIGGLRTRVVRIAETALGDGLGEFGLQNGTVTDQYAGWKIILANSESGTGTWPFHSWKNSILTVRHNTPSRGATTSVEDDYVYFVVEETLPSNAYDATFALNNVATMAWFDGYLTPDVELNGSELVADEVTRQYTFGTGTDKGQSRRLFLPLKAFCSSNFFSIDQMMKKLTTKLRFDFAPPENVVVRGIRNATNYKVYALNADLYLPFCNFGNIDVKHAFYNLTSSREEVIYRSQTQFDNLQTTTQNVIKLGDYSTVDEKLDYIIVGLKDDSHSWDYNPMTFSDCGLSHLEVKIDSIIAPYFKPSYEKAQYFDDLYFEFCQCRQKYFSRGGANVPVDILDKFASLDLRSWRERYPIICIDARRYMTDMKSVGDKINVSLRIRVGKACTAYTTVVTTKALTFGFSETRDTTITA